MDITSDEFIRKEKLEINSLLNSINMILRQANIVHPYKPMVDNHEQIRKFITRQDFQTLLSKGLDFLVEEDKKGRSVSLRREELDELYLEELRDLYMIPGCASMEREEVIDRIIEHEKELGLIFDV